MSVFLIDGNGDDHDPYWNGWSENDEGSGAFYEADFMVRELPWSHSPADFSLSISAAGQASMYYSYGDADGAVEASMTLPTEDGRLTTAGEFTLEVSGGDNASGAWGVEGTMTIRVIL